MREKTIFYALLAVLICVIFATPDMYAKSINEEEKLLRVGIGAYNDGFYDIAEKQFSQFIRDYPNNSRVYDVCYLLGKTLIGNGKLKEAKRVFSRIILEGKNLEYMDYTSFWVALIEIKLGNGEEAHKLLLSTIKRFPKFEWMDYAYYLLGLLEFGSNRLIQSESSFKKVALLSKNQQFIRSSWFWLGVLSAKQKDYEAAVGYFKGIWEEPKFVPQEYAKYALFWLGESHLKLSRFGEAKQHYRTFYERFKNDPLTSAAYWRLGFCDYRLGNIKDSMEIFQSFLKRSKDSQLVLYTHYLLGEIALLHEDYPSSIKELSLIFNLAKTNPLWGITALTLFWNYVRLGDAEGANKIFQRLQKLNPFEDEKIFIQWLNAQIIFSEGRISDSLPYYFSILNTGFREKALSQIGKGYFLENKFREAMTNLDILLLEFPNSVYIEESLFIKGECLIKLGNLEQALETYDLIVKKNRSSHWQLFALVQVGYIHSSRDENAKAEIALKRIIREFPDHPLFSHAAFQLGNLYFKEMDFVEAISYYSMVLKGKIFELMGQASFALGEIFYQQGKYDKALTNFEIAIGHLKETSIWFSLTQIEIGNLQKRRGRHEEAEKSYKIVLDQTKDEEIRKAAKELFGHIESN